MYLVTQGILRAVRQPTGGMPCTRRWSRSTGSARAGRWWSCWRRCCGSTPPTRPGTRPRRWPSWPTRSARPGWRQGWGRLVDSLSRLLRFDTTNPPGNEAEAVAFLADTLRQAGVEPEVLSPAPGRANLVARLPGDDGAEAPLLLNGHVDVVAAEAGRWRQPPVARECHDGGICRRGA